MPELPAGGGGGDDDDTLQTLRPRRRWRQAASAGVTWQSRARPAARKRRSPPLHALAGQPSKKALNKQAQCLTSKLPVSSNLVNISRKSPLVRPDQGRAVVGGWVGGLPRSTAHASGQARQQPSSGSGFGLSARSPVHHTSSSGQARRPRTKGDADAGHGAARVAGQRRGGREDAGVGKHLCHAGLQECGRGRRGSLISQTARGGRAASRRRWGRAAPERSPHIVFDQEAGSEERQRGAAVSRLHDGRGSLCHAAGGVGGSGGRQQRRLRTGHDPREDGSSAKD